MNIKDAIKKIALHEDLTEQEARDCFSEIMSGVAAPGAIGAFLMGLKMKGETISEITGAARVMRDKAVKINVRVAGPDDIILDTCGTGGSGKNIFNVSTAAMFVAAASGIKVAKHGNRGLSSPSGSADVLEALGVKIDICPEMTEKCINTIGIGFMFAPLYHGAMKYASSVRKEIGMRTIFNILGPLSNPAEATHQVMGVFDDKLTEIIAEVLKNLGSKRACIVHGEDGLDEMTITGRTKITELNQGKISTYFVKPEDFGLSVSSPAGISGGDAFRNAEIISRVLDGVPGPQFDMVVMNAAMSLAVAGKAKTHKDAAELAISMLKSGKAKMKLAELVEFTNKNKG
ncbi:MAG: anthranilate phosphoribosyltransferase [Candidatus Omnitrophica bacterium]|nr:anthranilate phosphoribosyltransferase [Candidatus Omnitrophota bacterium]